MDELNELRGARASYIIDPNLISTLTSSLEDAVESTQAGKNKTIKVRSFIFRLS